MKLRPFSIASSSTRLICWTLFVGWSQHASSRKAVSFQYHTSLVIHQSPQAESSWRILVIILANICLRGMLFTVSPHPFVTAVSHLFIPPSFLARSHLQTGKCPNNFLQVEKTLWYYVITAKGPRTALPRFHHRVLCFPPTRLQGLILEPHLSGFCGPYWFSFKYISSI